MTDILQGDALTVFNPASLEVYKDGLAAEVEKVATEARARVASADVTTDAGRQTIRSTAYKVARSKTALDDLGAKMVEEQKATVRAVDASRKKMRDQLDVLRDEVRKPLTEFEERERARVGAHEAMIHSVDMLTVLPYGATSVEIQQRLDQLERVPARDWEEFADRFAMVRLHVSTCLESYLQSALKEEASQAELRQLRAEALERERQDREAKIAAEAAERAQLAAEKAASLALAKEREAREAAEHRAFEAVAEAKAARDRELERIMREREEEHLAAEQAKQDAIDAAEREAHAAERRAFVHTEIEAVITAWINKHGTAGLVELIADGKVPHVSISYS